MRALIIITLSWLISVPAFASPGADEIEMRARTVGQSLRCVVCQNQSIDESDAPLAEDMRRLVRAQIKDGKTNEQVIEFMRRQYGDYVLLKPPVQGNTVVLWFAPIGLVGLALAWLALSARRRVTPQTADLSEAEKAQLAKINKGDVS